MALQTTVDELVTRLRAVLEARANVRFALLFGSAATRGPAQARDIDVAVSFTETPSLFDLGALANDLDAALGAEVIDVIDLDEASTLMRHEVAMVGRPIFTRSREALIEFLARIPLEYEDLRPCLEREGEGLRKAMESVRWSGSTSYAKKSAG
jgi:predicted nucleotidyltransferase